MLNDLKSLVKIEGVDGIEKKKEIISFFEDYLTNELDSNFD
jgi:hypothetical protein